MIGFVGVLLGFSVIVDSGLYFMSSYIYTEKGRVEWVLVGIVS